MEVDVPSDETLSQLVITEYTFSWWGAKVLVRFVRVQLLLASWVSVYRAQAMWLCGEKGLEFGTRMKKNTSILRVVLLLQV